MFWYYMMLLYKLCNSSFQSFSNNMRWNTWDLYLCYCLHFLTLYNSSSFSIKAWVHNCVLCRRRSIETMRVISQSYSYVINKFIWWLFINFNCVWIMGKCVDYSSTYIQVGNTTTLSHELFTSHFLIIVIDGCRKYFA